MARITTVIFDMYETLAENNTGLWLELFDRICVDQELKVKPQVLYQEWKSPELVFRRERLNLEEPEKSPPFKSYEEAWRDCFVHAFSKLNLQGDASAAAREAIQDMGLRQAYPDALEQLPAIQSRWRTGVLSNADDAYLLPLLDRIGWRFEAVLSSEGARAYKPLPRPFSKIMEQLGVEPEEAVYVGDNPFDDILGAKGMGMKAAWINRKGLPPDPQYPQPDFEIRNLGDLVQVLGAES